VRSLLQVVVAGSEAGEELPPFLPLVHEAGIRFRRGQLHVLAGQPGRGKTLAALWYAITSRVECLYFSADSDEGTIVNRALAVHMKETVSAVKKMRAFDEDDPAMVDSLWDLSNRIRIQTNPAPTLDDIYEECYAWIEMFGRCPELIVVDNLSNIQAMHDNEWTGLRDGLRALHTLARDTLSAVLVLHHTSESQGQPTQPSPMKATMGKVNALPEVILTIAMDGPRYHIAAVKNRDGKADPYADDPVTVYVDPESMSLFNTLQDLETAKKRREWIG